jgi:hypothetical protein
VIGAKHIAYWQEILSRNLELSKMLLWGETILQEMTSLWFLHLFQFLVPAAHLDSILAIVVLLLHLSNLASVDLKNCARKEAAPSVPKVGAANLVGKKSAPLTVPVNRLSLLKVHKVLLVDRPSEGAEGVSLVHLSKDSWHSHCFVID